MVVDIAIKDGKATPQGARVDVAVGQEVTLRVTSDHRPARRPLVSGAAGDGERLLAHGLGGATDLPIPFLYALVGASWALTISLAVLALAWKEPRFAVRDTLADPPARRPWLAVMGAVLTGWVLLALYGGPPTDDNGALGATYVLMWVGLVPLALLFGHVWRDMSPWRTIQSLVGRATGRPEGFADHPARLGYWPAAVGLFAFVWLELASSDPGSVPAVRIWIAVYAFAMIVGGIVFGPRWFDRADPFGCSGSPPRPEGE